MEILFTNVQRENLYLFCWDFLLYVKFNSLQYETHHLTWIIHVYRYIGLLTQFYFQSRDYDCIILNINEMQFLYGIHTTPANIVHTIKLPATNHRLPFIYKYTCIQLIQFTIVLMPSHACKYGIKLFSKQNSLCIDLQLNLMV